MLHDQRLDCALSREGWTATATHLVSWFDCTVELFRPVLTPRQQKSRLRRGVRSWKEEIDSVAIKVSEFQQLDWIDLPLTGLNLGHE
jgi:hypothetical protein